MLLTLIGRSWKSWKREKGLGVLAAVALAIGIGSATAIFTVSDAVLLRPLPYTQGDRWISLLAGDSRDLTHYSGLSFAELVAYQDRTHSFDVFGWFPVGGDFNLTSPGTPRHIQGIEVTPSLMANTGAAPVAGRFFTTSDGPNAAVISHRLFQEFGARIIGQPITLNGKLYIVAGAMPGWFRLPLMNVDDQNSQNDVWLPLQTPRDQNLYRGYAIYAAYGRLKPGVSVAQAEADAKRVAQQIRKENHPADAFYTAALYGLKDAVVKRIRPILLLLFGAAGLLLLITCANVAGLLVSRAVGRARETAIRVALGGGQKQMALQYFLESLWVSLAAALGGIWVSVLLVRMVLSLAADFIPRSDEVSTHWPAALFALFLAVLTATLSSLAPLWQALRTQPNEVLSDGVRASAGVRSRRLSQGLVVAEIALAFALVSAGALLLWQLRSLSRVWPGFDPNGVLTFQLTREGDGAKVAAYADKMIDALQAIPGVSDAALANQLPLAGCCFSTTLYPEGVKGSEAHQLVSFTSVSPSYFKTLRIPLLAGRLLTAHDTNENLISIVVGEDAAKRYWPHRNAVGEFVRLGDQNGGGRAQIVGVVGAVRNNGLGEAPQPEVYLLHTISPVHVMRFVVRSNLPRGGLTSAIRRATADVDPAQPIYSLQSMREIFDNSLVFERIESIVITLFALAALVMASLGVYGLMSYSVRMRTTEMGTRMALGATGPQLLQLIAGSGLRLSVYGIAGGAVAAAGLAGIVVRYFHVQLSPVPYLFSVGAVIAVALAASLIPAWRASLLSPLVAIRNEGDSIWTSALRALDEARERSSAQKASAPVDATLLTEFIEASRRANSFSEVLRVSLQDLRAKLKAESALLLERVSPGEFRCVAAEPAIQPATFLIPERGFLLNRLRFYGSPMSFTAADLETTLRWAGAHKPQQVKEIELLQAAGLRLAAPLRTKHELIGLLLFGEQTDGIPYGLGQKGLAAACAEQFALTVENGRLNERVLEQESVRRDIALATEVQRRLLPESSPQTAATSLGAFTLAARNVGGDYYDFLPMGEHSIGIALADVAGKGIAAALIMAVVQASLRIIASENNVSLPELAAKMNRYLHRSTGFNSYATFFYARLDEDKRQLRYVNAGHNPPYLVRALANAPIEELATGGMIIGMFPFANYEESVVDLQTGDVLIAFTDGVTEALNSTDEEFGEERLQELIRRVAALPVTDMTAAISRELREWIGDAPQHDDLTFVVMKVNEAAEGAVA
jgi:putative ABC transport system permease protein